MTVCVCDYYFTYRKINTSTVCCERERERERTNDTIYLK